MLNMGLQLYIVIHVIKMGQCQQLWLQFTTMMVKSLKMEWKNEYKIQPSI